MRATAETGSESSVSTEQMVGFLETNDVPAAPLVITPIAVRSRGPLAVRDIAPL